MDNTVKHIMLKYLKDSNLSKYTIPECTVVPVRNSENAIIGKAVFIDGDRCRIDLDEQYYETVDSLKHILYASVEYSTDTVDDSLVVTNIESVSIQFKLKLY